MFQLTLLCTYKDTVSTDPYNKIITCFIHYSRSSFQKSEPYFNGLKGEKCRAGVARCRYVNVSLGVYKWIAGAGRSIHWTGSTQVLLFFKSAPRNNVTWLRNVCQQSTCIQGVLKLMQNFRQSNDFRRVSIFIGQN